MSEFKLPPPRRLLRCDAPRHDDALVARDMPVFDEIATIESSPIDAPDLLLVIDELVDELAISLTMIADQSELDGREARDGSAGSREASRMASIQTRIAEVA